MHPEEFPVAMSRIIGFPGFSKVLAVYQQCLGIGQLYGFNRLQAGPPMDLLGYGWHRSSMQDLDCLPSDLPFLLPIH
jgi:hypothetical protein